MLILCIMVNTQSVTLRFFYWLLTTVYWILLEYYGKMLRDA